MFEALLHWLHFSEPEFAACCQQIVFVALSESEPSYVGSTSRPAVVCQEKSPFFPPVVNRQS